MSSNQLLRHLTNNRELGNQTAEVEAPLLSRFREISMSYLRNHNVSSEFETMMLSYIEVLITYGLLGENNMNRFVENLLKSDVSLILAISTLHQLQLLAKNGLLDQKAFNNIIQDPYKYRPILMFIVNVIEGSLSILNKHNVSTLLDDQHNIIKIMLLRKLDKKGELDEIKYQEIIGMSDGQFDTLIRMLFKKTMPPEILSDKNIEIFLGLINNKIKNNGGSSAVIEPIMQIFMKLQDNNLLTSDNVSDIFSALISHADITSLATTLRCVAEFLPNNHELFNKIIGLPDISGFLTALLTIQEDVTEENVKLLLHAKNPQQLVMLWNNIYDDLLPDINVLVESNDIDAQTKNLYVGLEENQKKLVLFLCKTALEQSQLDFDRLKTIITQVATKDISLLNLIIPDASGYLNDDKKNMQLIYAISKAPELFSIERNIGVLQDTLSFLIKHNIITKENKLGQDMFDALIQQLDDNGDEQIFESTTLYSLDRVCKTLLQLNILGTETELNDGNLKTLLAHMRRVKEIDKVLQILKQQQLINTNNAQTIFEQIIKLPNIADFIEALELLDKNKELEFLTEKNLHLLLHAKNPQQLVTLWNNIYDDRLPDIDVLVGSNDIDEQTKNLYVGLEENQKKLVLFLCQKLLDQSELDFDHLKIIIQQVATLSDSELLYLIIPDVSGYLNDDKKNMQLIYAISKAPELFSIVRNIGVLQNTLSFLIKHNIITKENKLGQDIFDALIQQLNDNGDEQIFESTTLYSLERVCKTLLQLNILGTETDLNNDNLKTLLSEVWRVKEIDKVLQVLKQQQLIDTNNAQIIFEQIIKLPNIDDFIEALRLLNKNVYLTQEKLNLLLNAKNLKQLVILWSSVSKGLLPDIGALVESKDIDEPTKKLYVGLNEQQQKLIVVLCKNSLEQLQLDFERLKIIIQQVATLSDSELLYLIIPNVKGYLDDSKSNINMQVIYQMLLSSPSISEFTSFFNSLIAHNIITQENKLGQEIFDAFSQYNISLDLVTYTWQPLLETLRSLNLLGGEVVKSSDNLRQLLTKKEEIRDISRVVNSLKNNRLINTGNAQIIFDQIMKLSAEEMNILDQVLAISSIAQLTIKPNMLQALLKSIGRNNNQELFFLWSLCSNSEKVVSISVAITRFNSIDEATKKLFAQFSSDHQQLLLGICKQLLEIDIPVDFNMFSILVNTPKEHLEKLQQQLLKPDMCSSQAETFGPSANLQFLAIYTKAVHKKLYDLYKKDSPELVANDQESSMKDEQLKKSNERFLQLSIKYDPILREYGGIEKVEQKIREKLLEAIRQEQEGKSNSISNFFEQHSILELATCAADPNDPLTQEMRKLFVSNEYPSPQIAWRAYDSGAATVAWPNLLTPSSSDEKIFSTTESRAGMTDEFNMGTATIHARTYAALAFLASQDKELNDIQQNDIWQDFVCYIGEIRRAHNETNQGTDNPSCFPGTISRISQIINKHRDFAHVNDEATAVIKNNVRAYVNILLKKSLSELSNEQDKEKLFLSLMFMHDLDDTILQPDSIFKILPDIDDAEALTIEKKQEIIQQYMQVRADFFRKLSAGIVEYINNKLRERNISISPAQMNYLMGECLVNISSSLSISQQDIYPSIEALETDSSDTEETLVTDDLPKPNESAKNSSNKLFAITDYWVPTLKLEIFQKLNNIINDKKLCIAIIDELFSGVLRSLHDNPSKEVLISHLRKKNIEQIFSTLIEEEHSIENAVQKINKEQKEQIVKALASVYGNFGKENQTTNATPMPKKSTRLLSMSVKKQTPGPSKDRYNMYKQRLPRKKRGGALPQ